MHRFDTHGQANIGVGALVGLLIFIAIGAFVTYEITSEVNETAQEQRLTTDYTEVMDNEAENVLAIYGDGVNSATSSLAYTVTDTTELTVVYNSTTIVFENVTVGSGTIENDVASLTVIGNNTENVQIDNTDRVITLATTLTVQSYTKNYSENAIDNVEDKGDTTFSLITILAIVLVAALIIGVVMRSVGGAIGGGAGTVAPAL